MSPRATRRGILALAPAAALAPASAAGAASHPDAELLAACTRFRALTAHHAALFEAIDDDDKRDSAIDAMHDEWGEALDTLCAAPPARTLDGLQARAKALTEYDPELLKDRHGYWNDGQLAALLRDLLALPKGAA